MQNNPETSSTSGEARRYQAIKNRLFLFNIAMNFIFLVVFVSCGFSRGLKGWLFNFAPDFFFINALYFVFFSGIAFCLSLPLDFYEGYILEHRFGLSRQNIAGWLRDTFKKSAIIFVVSLVLVEAVYFFLLRFSSTWWLLAAVFWFFVSVILTKIAPRVILPIFFKYTPLEEGLLKTRIFNLLKQFNINLKDVYVLDFSRKTVKANAMVAGLGRTKQIFLSDTLVGDFSVDEIEVVLAHEMGHYLSGDTLKLTSASLCSALLSFFAVNVVLNKLIVLFGLNAISDIAGLPLLLVILLILSLVLLPLQNGFMRFLETRADIFALDATKNPDAFIRMMNKLGRKNFSEFFPSRLSEIFLYDHPPISKRIKLAQTFGAASGLKP